MKTIEIKCSLRKDLGKKATKMLRKSGNVPCVMYGGGKENINFYAPVLSFKNLVYSPSVYLVDISFDEKKYTAIMKDLQFHPVSDQINHIDFIEISEDKEVEMSVPVKVVGNAVGVKKGGRLRLIKRTLKVKALPKNLPDYLEVNVDELEIGQNVKVGDLEFKNISLINQSREPIVSVLSSRIVTKEEEEGAAAEAGTVPGTPAAEAPAGKTPAATPETK